MPAVFVHGNPETAAVWEPLLAELTAPGWSDVVNDSFLSSDVRVPAKSRVGWPAPGGRVRSRLSRLWVECRE